MYGYGSYIKVVYSSLTPYKDILLGIEKRIITFDEFGLLKLL